jgi:hypothetical protein
VDMRMNINLIRAYDIGHAQNANEPP